MSPADALELHLPGGGTLRGVRWSGDARRALLIHDLARDIDSLRVIAGRLRSLGMTVVAIDRLGHGASDGDLQADGGGYEVDALVTALGWDRPGWFLVAAGDGIGTGLPAAMRCGADAVALIAPERCDDVLLPSGGNECRVLVVYAGRSRSALDAAERYRRLLTAPVTLVSLPAAEGDDLLSGRSGVQAANHVAGFFRRVAERVEVWR
jgi:pimeloyl-ACP methyl ester carboxylesterase